MLSAICHFRTTHNYGVAAANIKEGKQNSHRHGCSMFYIKNNTFFKVVCPFKAPKEDKQNMHQHGIFHGKNNTFKRSFNLFVSSKPPTLEKANKNSHQHGSCFMFYVKTFKDFLFFKAWFVLAIPYLGFN